MPKSAAVMGWWDVDCPMTDAPRLTNLHAMTLLHFTFPRSIS